MTRARRFTPVTGRTSWCYGRKFNLEYKRGYETKNVLKNGSENILRVQHGWNLVCLCFR